MSIMKTILLTVTVGACLPGVAAAAILPRKATGIELPDIELTFYYDPAAGTDGGVCYKDHAAAGGTSMKPDWAVQMNNGVGACAKDPSQIMLSMANENLVGSKMVSGAQDGADGGRQHCGKELIIYDAAGNPVTHNGKNFIVWDACPDSVCTGGVGLDMSAAAIRSIDPAACVKGRVPGYTAVITDKVVLDAAIMGKGAPTGGSSSTGGSSAAPQAPPSGAGGQPSQSPPNPANPSGPLATPFNSAAPPPPVAPAPPTGQDQWKPAQPAAGAPGAYPAGPGAGACTPAIQGSPCWTQGAPGYAAGVVQVCTAVEAQPGSFVWQAGEGACAC